MNTMDWQPRLQGRLLETRPLVAEDHDALYAVARDPLIWEQHPDRERHLPAGFRRYFDSGIASGGALAVLDRESGALVGCSRYYDLSAAGSSVTIGYTFLARSCWGRGHNRELKHLMVGYALQRVACVYFVVGEHNRRSRAAMTRLGARLLPRESYASLPLSGDLQTSVVFLIDQAIFARSFAAEQAALTTA